MNTVNRNKISLEELAIQYAKYCNHSMNASATNTLEELKRRDKLNGTNVEKSELNDPDQLVFDFHKEVVFMRREQEQLEETNNVNVKNEWKEAYETGYRIGERIGIKQGLEQAERGVPGVLKCDCEEKKCEE